jgi:renal tumor antigen
VKLKRSNEFYAVKRLKKRYRTVEDVHKLPEILSLQQLQGHPNIISLIDIIYNNKNGYVAMVFELMDCNVYELINEHKRPFDERTTIILSYQLLSAIAFVHSRNMFHRDVKPENCMVNRDTMELKLADFGSARGIDSRTPAYTEYVSTRWYRAPECILTSGSYGPEVDEWAVGCMIYELLTARPLFPGKHEIDQIARIHSLLGTPTGDVLAQFSQNPNTQISLSFAPRAPQDFHTMLPNASDALVDLMLRLLTYNPADTIPAAEAVDHPAFAEVRECQRACEPGVPLSYFFLTRGRAARPTIMPQQRVGLVQPRPKQPAEHSLAESRIKAQQRIKLWQQKNVQAKPAHPFKAPAAGIGQHEQPYEPPGPNLLFQ